MTIDEMKAKLELTLTPKRFRHSLEVMAAADELAKKYGYDASKASIAGLLHDCARDIRGVAVFEKCKELGVKVDEISQQQPELLHGKIGSIIATEEYGVCDTEILDAIRYHTTGFRNMGLLSKIIFLADYIEPGRSFPGVNEVRKEASFNLNRAMLMALDRTVIHVLSKGALLHPDTIDARNAVILETLGKKEHRL